MKNKIIHVVAAFVLFAVPAIVNSHAAFQDITIGSILNAVYLYCSQIVNPTAPTYKV